jgi:hypothetical protein
MQVRVKVQRSGQTLNRTEGPVQRSQFNQKSWTRAIVDLASLRYPGNTELTSPALSPPCQNFSHFSPSPLAQVEESGKLAHLGKVFCV